jgi:hypothetical protein
MCIYTFFLLLFKFTFVCLPCKNNEGAIQKTFYKLTYRNPRHVDGASDSPNLNPSRLFLHNRSEGFVYKIFSDMQRENEHQQDEKLLNLFPNVLMNLRSIGGGRFSETYEFFKTAFLELTENELFDDPIYRQQWQDNLNVIDSVAIPYKGYTNEEIIDAIKIVEIVLLENRKKVLDA